MSNYMIRSYVHDTPDVLLMESLVDEVGGAYHTEGPRNGDRRAEVRFVANDGHSELEVINALQAAIVASNKRIGSGTQKTVELFSSTGGNTPLRRWEGVQFPDTGAQIDPENVIDLRTVNLTE